MTEQQSMIHDGYSKAQARLVAFMNRNNTDGVWIKRHGWIWRSDAYGNAKLAKRACKKLHLKT